MYTNRALKLLFLLGSEEQKEFLHFLKRQNKSKIGKTTKIILKLNQKENILCKELIFEEIFKKPYEEKFDYLLRNEFRLLAKEIEDFYGSSDIFPLANGIKAMNFLYLILRSQDAHFIEKEFKSKSADLGIGILTEWFKKMEQQYMIHTMNHSEKQLHNINKTIDNQYDLILKNAAIKLGDLNVKKAIVQRQMEVLGVEQFQEIPNSFQIHVNAKSENKTVQYLHYKKQSYTLFGQPALKNIKMCEKLLPELEEGIVDLYAEFIWVYSNLGYHYYLINDLKRSAINFKKAIDNKDFFKYPLRANIIYNYISACLKYPNYAHAAQSFEQYEQFITSNPALEVKFTFLKIILYLHLNKEKESKQLFKQLKVGDKNHDLFYYKSLQLLISIYFDEYERAQMNYRSFRLLKFSSVKLNTAHKDLVFLTRHYLKLYDKWKSLHELDVKSSEAIAAHFRHEKANDNYLHYNDSLLFGIIKAKAEEIQLKFS